MKLLLDFGNTRVKAAVSDGSTLRVVYSGPLESDALTAAVSEYDTDGGMWCSVRPIDQNILLWLNSLGLKQLDWATPVPIKNLYHTPQTLGMDRLAAAVGAWSLKPGKDILVIDAGTAITFDFVTSAGEYMGGNIAPGVELRLKSLHEHTGALPLVSRIGPAPRFGYDTDTAIRSGVINGIANEIMGYVAGLESEYPSVLVFLTGGDAESFALKCKSGTFAVTDLVLTGLDCICRFNETDS